MKICDITNFFSPKSGGVKTYLLAKRRYINAAGGAHRHLLIVPGEKDETVDEGFARIRYVAGPQVPWERNYRYVKNLCRVAEIIDEERPDLIELGCPYLMPWAVRRVARHHRIPLVGFFHSNFPETYVGPAFSPYGRWLGRFMQNRAWGYARLIYGMCDQIIATSEHAEQSLAAARIKPVTRIPFGVDTDTFDPAKADGVLREKLGFRPDQTLLLFVGRLTEEKDISSLLTAFRTIDDAHPGRFGLMVVGSGPETATVEMLAAERVSAKYLGYRTPGDGLPEAYATADIFVTPSPNETFGLSPLEALASGLPVVAVRGGAVAEILPEAWHEIADPWSPPTLAAAVLRMADRRTPEMRGDIRRFIVQNYSWDACFARIFDLYARIVAERRR